MSEELQPYEAQTGKIVAVETRPSATPTDLIRYAIENNADLDALERLYALQTRYEADQARKLFNIAFAKFKAEAVHVYKGTVITDGPLKGKRHANLFDVVVASAAPLARHGLSTSWSLTKDEPGLMEVTCVLKHSAGHSESVSMMAAPDTGPGRNAIQARGSTKTYLERYTLMAILGLAATDQEDDDGQGSEVDDSEEAAIEKQWLEHLSKCETTEALKTSKKSMVDDYKGESNIPAELLKQYLLKGRELAGLGK